MDIKELLKDEAAKIDIDERRAFEARNQHARAAASEVVERPARPVSIGQFLGVSDERLVRRVLNPFLFYKHMPVALSTDRADSYDNLAIQWSFSNGQLNWRQGIISSKDLVKNIIGMRISGGYLPWNTLTLPPYTRQVYIQVAEFAHLAMNNGLVAWHFVLSNVANDANNESVAKRVAYATFKPNFDGYFWFPAPVQDLDTFTIRVATQNTYVDARRVPVGKQGVGITTTFPLEIKTVDTVTPRHDLKSGDTVYFYSVLTDPDTPVMNEELMREEGWVVTVINDVNFTIPFDPNGVDVGNIQWWSVPSVPREFTMNIDLIYLGEQR